MQIRVRFFAALRDTLGMGEQTLELPAAATVASAWAALVAAHPALDAASSLAYAVNRAYASLDTALHDGDELALIPPVSGG
ncbi:MAG: molybdopterin converting factor subunit 1 [Herpetosiphonaceae bacterium]|nr:molybdopterin converting factor subunit 1 [Herpetosiphonaceae bacterium]